MKIRIRVPATTANLGPGFDALGLALTLWNEAEFSTDPRSGDQITLSIEGEGAGKLARDGSNLIVKAASAVFQRAGEHLPPLHIRCVNRIPPGAGLGSSAAAVLAGMLAANALIGESLPPEVILQLAVAQEGHPDNVAPALLGGLVVSSAASGRVLARKIDLPPATRASLHVTVVIPDLELPTSQARAALPRQVSLEAAVGNISRAVLLVEALRTGDLGLLGEAMQDALHEPYRLPLIPGAREAMLAARAAGAAAVALSGAGPGLVAFYEGQASRIGSAMQAAFADAGLRARSFDLGISEQGAQVASTG